MEAKMTLIQKLIDLICLNGHYKFVDDNGKSLTGSYFYDVRFLKNDYVAYYMEKGKDVLVDVEEKTSFSPYKKRKDYLKDCEYNYCKDFNEDFILLYNDNKMKIYSKTGRYVFDNCKVLFANSRFVVYASSLDYLAPCKFLYTENGEIKTVELKQFSQAKLSHYKEFDFTYDTIKNFYDVKEAEEFLSLLKLLLCEDIANFNKTTEKYYVFGGNTESTKVSRKTIEDAETYAQEVLDLVKLSCKTQLKKVEDETYAKRHPEEIKSQIAEAQSRLSADLTE